MDLNNVLASIRRRWYFVLVGLVLAGATGVGLFMTVPPTYEQASSSVLIPGARTVEEGMNPLLYLSGLTQQRDLVVRAMQSDENREPVLDKYPDADFSVTADLATSGPVIAVVGSGRSPQETLAVLKAAQAAVTAQLTVLQDAVDAPQDARSTLLAIATDSEATVLRSNQLKMTVAGAGAVLLLSVLLAIFVDGRSRTRHLADDEPGDEGPGQDDGRIVLESRPVLTPGPVRPPAIAPASRDAGGGITSTLDRPHHLSRTA